MSEDGIQPYLLVQKLKHLPKDERSYKYQKSSLYYRHGENLQTVVIEPEVEDTSGPAPRANQEGHGETEVSPCKQKNNQMFSMKLPRMIFPGKSRALMNQQLHSVHEPSSKSNVPATLREPAAIAANAKSGLRETINVAHNFQEICKTASYRAEDIIAISRLVSAPENNLKTAIQLAEDAIMKAAYRETVRVAGELSKLADLEGVYVEDKELRK